MHTCAYVGLIVIMLSRLRAIIILIFIVIVTCKNFGPMGCCEARNQFCTNGLDVIVFQINGKWQKGNLAEFVAP